MNPHSLLFRVNAGLFVFLWAVILVASLFSPYPAYAFTFVAGMAPVGKFITYFSPNCWNWVEQRLLPKQGTTIALIAAYVVAGLLLIGLNSGFVGGWKVYREIYPEKALSDGDAVAPSDNLIVRHPSRFKGKVWVVLQQPNKLYYPLSDAVDPTSCAVVAPDLTQNPSVVKGPVNVGEAEDGIKQFTILLVQTDDAADQSFKNTLNQWCKTKKYPGLKSLPKGSETLNTLQLKRLK